MQYILKIFIAFVVLTYIMLFYGIFYSPTGLKGYLNKKSQFMLLKEQVVHLTHENMKMYNKIRRFNLSPSYRMELVRERTGWIGNNEKVIIFTSKKHMHGVK